jgi:hypothetical protein
MDKVNTVLIYFGAELGVVAKQQITSH